MYNTFLKWHPLYTILYTTLLNISLMSCKPKGTKGSTGVSNPTPITATQTQEGRTPNASKITASTPKSPVDVTTDDDNTVPTPMIAQESKTLDPAEISASTIPVDVTTTDGGDNDGGSDPTPTAAYEIPPPHNPCYSYNNNPCPPTDCIKDYKSTGCKTTKQYKPTKTLKRCKKLDERRRQQQKQLQCVMLNLRCRKFPLPKLAANLEKLEKEKIELIRKRVIIDSAADLPNDKKRQKIRTINQKLEEKNIKIGFFTKKIQKKQKKDQIPINTSSSANANDSTTSENCAKYSLPEPTAPPNSPMSHNSPYWHPLYPVLEPVRLPSPPPPYEHSE